MSTLSKIGTEEAALSKDFAKAANDEAYHLSPDEQATQMVQRLNTLEEYAQSPDATISDFLEQYKTGHSELEGINASPDDVSTIIDGYEKNAAVIELPTKLQTEAATEAIEIAADIQFVYDMGEAEAIRLNTTGPTEEELKSDTALDAMRSFEGELLNQVQYAQDFTALTGISVEISKEVLETASEIQRMREFEANPFPSTTGISQNNLIDVTSTAPEMDLSNAANEPTMLKHDHTLTTPKP